MSVGPCNAAADPDGLETCSVKLCGAMLRALRVECLIGSGNLVV